jgi:integrase
MLVEAAEHRRHPMATMGDQTFAELVAKWREIGASDLEKSTLFEYERLLERRLLPRFGAKKLRSIRPVDLDTYYAELHRGDWGVKPLGALSIQHVHAVLRMLLNQAVRWEWIPTNPASKASPPRVLKSQRTIPSPQAVRRILEDCEHHDPELACFLRLAAVSGARRGEVCALRWSDIDLEGGYDEVAVVSSYERLLLVSGGGPAVSKQTALLPRPHHLLTRPRSWNIHCHLRRVGRRT